MPRPSTQALDAGGCPDRPPLPPPPHGCRDCPCEVAPAAAPKDGRPDLEMIQRYLEAWSARQEELLQDALGRVVAACDGVRSASGHDVEGSRRTDLCGLSGGSEHTVSDEIQQMLAGALEHSPETPWKSSHVSAPARPNGMCIVRKLSSTIDDLALIEEEETPGTKLGAQLGADGGSNATPISPTVNAEKENGWSRLRSLSTNTLPKPSKWQGMRRERWSRLRLLTASIVESTAFDALCGGAIFANAISIAYSTDMSLQEAIGRDSGQLDLVNRLEVAFIVFYTLELALRLFVYRRSFVISKDWVWNTFDIFLVLLALYDIFTAATGIASGSTNFSFMRLLKVLKVMKTLRTVRVLRMFRELRLMIESVLGSLKSLVWALIMIALVTYVFGCIFTQAMALYLPELPPGDAKAFDEIMYYWSTVLRSMNTLYMCSTSGESWRYPSDHLANFSGVVYMLFLIYISFFAFVVVNSLTSIIIEATMNHATKERSEIIAEELKRKRAYIKQFEELFKKLDEDGSGDVSMAELEAKLQDEGMLAFMQSLEIDASDISQFFSLLALDGSTAVDIETFVVGCMKLKGGARSMDLLCLYNSHLNQVRSHKKFEKKLTSELRRLQESSRVALCVLGALLPPATRAQVEASVFPQV